MNKPPDRRVSIFPNKRTMDGVMLEEWSAVSQASVLRSGRFVAALSGGRTPVSFYERLAASGRDLPWEKTHIFQADERLVPAGHPASNLRMIEAKLLHHVPIPAVNVHAVPIELAPGAAAGAYDQEMRDFFGLKEWDLPRFDLILLGLGEDGHTASLFPGAEGLWEGRRLAVPALRPAPDHDRVSLSLLTINAAHVVIVLVTGKGKASVLKAVLEGPAQGLPAALVRTREGRSVFLADKAAGSLLTSLPGTSRGTRLPGSPRPRRPDCRRSARRKPKVTTLFLDIGGVLLSNGWDHNARAAAASEFGFPVEEMNLRHDQIFGTYEEGQISLIEYLERAVFFKERPFTRDEFKAFMFARSQPYPEMLEFFRGLKKRYRLRTVAVSNEGRELTVYRNEKFGLPGLLDFFVSSCFVRMRKPDPDIYRLALDLAQVRTSEVVYVENTEMFVDVARGLGIPTIFHAGFEATVEAFRELGLTLE